MPYRNIHWIKLEIRLLNDPRFFLMSKEAQLIYIKILMLCGQNNNKVHCKYPILRELLRTDLNEPNLEKIMEEIKTNFPKVIQHKDFYSIKGFSQKHNQVIPRLSPEYAGATVDKIREEESKIRKEKNKELLQFFSSLHKEITGVPYPITYGKDQKLIAELGEIYDMDTLKTLITEFFNGAKDKSEWWFDKQLSMGMFKSCVPQVINRIRKK